MEVLLAAGSAGAVPDTRAVNALMGQQVNLFAVVRVGRGRRLRYFTDAPALRIRGREVSAARLSPFAALNAGGLRWQRVEPQPHHVNTSPPNEGNLAYSNAVLFGKRHGAWLGYDTIEYVETDIPGARSPGLTITRVKPTNAKVDVNGGLGTMRYRVVVQLGDRELFSPGAEATTRQGISPRVMRVTFRSGDTLAGHIRGYFNVPNVFGSAGGSGRRHQAAHYQGADCADVIIGAARAAGARLPYTSVAGLKGHSSAVTPRLLLKQDGVYTEDGKTRVALPFGKTVRSGDIMLIDYYGFNGSPRSWDHIALVDADGGKTGQFDPGDPVLHMGYLYGLTEVPAHTEGPAYIQFRRLKKKYRRQMARKARKTRKIR